MGGFSVMAGGEPMGMNEGQGVCMTGISGIIHREKGVIVMRV